MTTLKGTDRFTYSVNDNPTITYTNPDGENVTSLQACIQIDDGYGMFTAVEYRDIPKTGTHYTFSLTDNEREKLFGSVPREVYDGDINTTALVFRIRTVKDGINYFSSLNRNFVFSPWITASVVDENELTVALTGDPNVIVKYNSFAKAVMTAEARSGAAIDESLYIIRNGSQNGYSKEYTFLFPESDEFTFIASDSWEVPSSVTITQPMVDYIPLTQNIHYERPDATGKATIGCSGNWFNGSFGAVVNTLTAQCRYAISGDAFSDDWIDMSVTSNGNSYYATANIEIADFKQELSYIFEMRVTDKLDALQEQSDPVKSIPIFHWGENDFVFEVPVTFKNGTEGVDLGENPTIKGGLNVKGYLRLKSGDDNGDAVLFGDGADCYIMVSKDGEMFIKANKVDMSAEDGVYTNGKAIPTLDSGTWIPSLNSGIISSYTTQYGWYSRVGSAVTIGFFIKATCKSGYHTSTISITGLPWYPAYSASGGGMCSGAYISNGYNFQCFVAETGGNITARVQSCNNSVAANLSTSASGCFYRNGGGEITLSGTITYIAS